MATITGFTAERAQEIEDLAIVSGTVIDGDLILTRNNESTINAGSVVGPKGDQGTAGGLVGGYVEPLDNKGDVSGTVTLNFGTHNVWLINPTAPITIEFSNLPPSTHVSPGTLIVANSFHAITWPGATKFPNGIPPVLSGETFLSLFARNTHVTVGTAWPAVV